MTRDAIELFAGGGILGRAARDVGLVDRVRVQVELDPFARSVLERHEPEAARIPDVRDARNLGACFAVLGGFPCQDLSVAGKGAGLDGEKSGLWREMRRVIEECGPRVVIVENAGRGWGRWVPVVRSELWARGYASVPLHLSAAEVGAPHHRLRCFLVATPHADGERLRLLSGRSSGTRGAAGPAELTDDGAAGADSHADGQGELQQEGALSVLGRWARNVREQGWWAEWPARAVVPRVDDGVADRLLASDRLHRGARERLCGNGIVYPVALAVCGAVAEVMA